MAAAASNEWMKDWESLSRQYWKAWQDISAGAQSNSARDAATAPWHEGLEQWSRLFDGGKQGDTIERLLASAKTYTAFMQAMTAAAAAGKEGDFGKAAWTDALRQGFNLAGADPGLLDNPVARAMREVSGKGAQGFQDMMKQFLEAAAPFTEGAKSWLDLPAFGYAREHQEHYQKSAQAMVEYQEQLARYNALMLKASQRGFQLFEDKLAEREEPGRQIDSLRALYDLWVDAAEEGYAEIALSPEFREVYGALVNAQMRVRSQVQQEVERLSTDLGMPTRTELNSIGQRVQELRRALRERTDSGASNDVSTELASLRREVDELRKALASIAPKPATAAAKPAAARSGEAKKSAAGTKAAPRNTKRRG
jgi:class III poly(R)-hydroxyalkanoic acid synthase PhaE subunit